jgi:hypothetical protein
MSSRRGSPSNAVAFATVLTLVVVPVLYTVFFRIPSPQKAK